MRLFGTLQGVFPLLLGLVVLTLFWLMATLVQEQADDRQREHQRIILGELRGKLEGELNASLNLTAGLAAYVATHGGISRQTFEAMAAHLLNERSLVHHIALAPDNVIRYIYPMAGNEAALGLDLLGHNDQGHMTRLMIQRGQPIVAGPLELVQGDRALIHRVPIYVDDPHAADASPRYWGLMSAPIRYQQLLQDSGLERVSQQMELALRGVDGQGERGVVFYGNPRLFDQDDSLFTSVRVLHGSWQLAARPIREQSRQINWLVNSLRLAGIVVGGLLGWFAWRVTRQGAALARSERLYRDLTEHMQDVVFQTDANRHVTYLNPAWTRLTGFAIAPYVGRDWVNLVDPHDRPRAEGSNIAFVDPHDSGAGYVEEFRVPRKEGEPLWMVVRARVHHDAKGKVIGTIGTMVDITARKAAEQRVHYLAMHDNLTGLPNRLLLQDRFLQSHAHVLRQNRAAALDPGAHKAGLAFLFLDLDGFKLVNDRFGHEIGDQVLRIVTERFQSQLREVDTLARLGGDEFAVLLECHHNREEAILVAEKLIHSVSQVMEVEGHQCQVGVSIGISLYPEHGDSLDELITRADDAMYQAKSAGKGCWRIWQHEKTG